jgi:hypothetical protein
MKDKIKQMAMLAALIGPMSLLAPAVQADTLMNVSDAGCDNATTTMETTPILDANGACIGQTVTKETKIVKTIGSADGTTTTTTTILETPMAQQTVLERPVVLERPATVIERQVPVMQKPVIEREPVIIKNSSHHLFDLRLF